MNIAKAPIAAALSLGFTLGLVSCGTNAALKSAQLQYSQGNMEGAVASINGVAAKQEVGDKDSVIVYLEQGNILATAGQCELAQQAFINADKSIEAIDEKGKLQVGKEAAAQLTNNNALDYKGSPAERMMGAAYLATTFLANGDKNAALSGIKLAKNRQAQIFSRFQAEIDKEQASLAEVKKEKGVKFKDNTLDSQQAEVLKSVAKYKAYNQYAVPYAEALAGAVLDVAAASDADIGRARESFRRALSCYPRSTALQKSASSSRSGMTHVFIEDGVGPKLGENKFRIPIFYENKLTMLVVAYPTFEPQPLIGEQLGVVAGGATHTGDLICDFDRMAGAEYKRRLPGAIARNTSSAIIKAVAGIAAQKVAEQQGQMFKLAAMATSMVANEMSARADERIWATLPKQVRYVCIPTPSSGELTIGGQPVVVQSGKGNVVIARAINGQVFARTSKL